MGLRAGGFRGLAAALALAAAFLAAAALCGTARAQEAEAPAEGRPPAPAPAPAPPPAEDPVPITFGEDRVTSPEGWTVLYYRVNFVDPKVLRTELDQWKTKEARIEPMANATGQPTNVLRIQERKENLPLLERMMEILDQPQPQVLVRAKLVEVTYQDNLEFGFEAGYTLPGDTFLRGADAVFNPESFLNSSVARPFQGTSVGASFVGPSAERYGNLDYIARFLKSKGKAVILGEPNILATQGQQATIEAGEKVPIQQSNISGTNLVISTKFEDTGIKLTILPELIGETAVRMKITQEYSAVTGFVLGQGGIQNPVINKRKAETVLTVRDGVSFTIGGLQSNRTLQSRSGVPLLMDVPLVGWLFSTTATEEVQTELLFIVTPEIIRGSYAEGLIKPPSERVRLEGLGW